MSARLKRNWHMLKILMKAKKPKHRRAILDSGNDDLVMAICEIVDNVLRGTVKLKSADKQKLVHYKKVMRDIANKRVAKKQKKKLLLSQKGGFLPVILAPALALVASLVGEVVGKAISK